jgi:hypothetical protein
MIQLQTQGNSFMKTNSLLVTLGAFAFALSGCAAEIEEDGKEPVVENAAHALTLSGATATWRYISTPSLASRIAADSYGYVWALNDDHALYRSYGGLAWTYLGYPGAAEDISAQENYGSIYALNWDKAFYRNSPRGLDSEWAYLDYPYAAIRIGAIGTTATALNGDGTVWKWNNGWTHVKTFLGATDVDGGQVGSTGAIRWFVLKDGDVSFTNGSDDTLTNFQLVVGGVRKSVRDIAAGNSTVIWALTDERELYRGTFAETACTDGVDNDMSGSYDGYDSTCTSVLAQNLCNYYARSGDFCLDRRSASAATLVTCSGTSVSSVRTSDVCNWVGSGGSDYLSVIW